MTSAKTPGKPRILRLPPTDFDYRTDDPHMAAQTLVSLLDECARRLGIGPGLEDAKRFVMVERGVTYGMVEGLSILDLAEALWWACDTRHLLGEPATSREAAPVVTSAPSAEAELKPATADAAGRQPIKGSVATARYYVTKGTLRRALKAGKLTDCRLPGHVSNAALLLDEREVASQWPPRPVV